MGDKLQDTLLIWGLVFAVLDHELAAILLLVAATINVALIAWALRDTDADA